MKSPFTEIRKKRKEFWLTFASRAFASGSTFRMFRGKKSKKSKKIREHLRRKVGRGESLIRARSQAQFDAKLIRAVRSLKESFKLNFGQAAKLVNLYVKELGTRRGVLHGGAARRIYRGAHVPLDRIILKHMWKDFPECMAAVGMSPHPSIQGIREDQYRQLQAIIRVAANKQKCAALDYDLWWAEEERRGA